jgi:hypothetical protein
LGESLRVDERVDLGDLSVGDAEGHHRKHSPARSYHGSRRAVDERRPHEWVQLGIGGRVPYHGLASAKNARGFRAQHAAIDPELDVGIEHGDERVKVAIARSGEERIDDLPLSRKVRIRLRGSPHTAPGAAGQLLRCGLGTVKGTGDVRKRHVEHPGWKQASAP